MATATKSNTEQFPALLLQEVREINLRRQPKVTFPLPCYPTNPYWHGKPSGNKTFDQTRFGRFRDGGIRLHAAIDLEAPIGTHVLAMADGFVIRSTLFYSATFDLVVLHPGIGIIRYGEVDPNSIIYDVRTYVRQGQPIAKVGQRVENGRRNPRAMLHLEFFRDETRITGLDADKPNALSPKRKTGTMAHPQFERRMDMENPTNLVESAPLYDKKPLRREGDGWRDTGPFSHPHLTEEDTRSLYTSSEEEIMRAMMLHPLDEATVQMLMSQAELYTNK